MNSNETLRKNNEKIIELIPLNNACAEKSQFLISIHTQKMEFSLH